MASFPPPSFFKVLLHPKDPHLPLPTDFVSKHMGNKIPKDPIIRTSNGGYLWKLKIIKIGDNYRFTHGWSNVVEDIQLGFGYILLFRLVDTSIFELLIYSPTGCQRILPPKIKVEHDVVAGVCNVDDDDTDGDDDANDDDVNIDGDVGDLSFTMVISKLRTLRLPEEFVYLPGIKDGKNMTVKNLEGEEQQLGLRLDKAYDYKKMGRYVLSTGWKRFKESNKLMYGDECMFKFIKSEGKLCLVKVTKNQRPPMQDDGVDVESEDENDKDDGDPFFKLTITKGRSWRLPVKFTGLPGIEDGKSITVKNLEGEEQQLGLRLDKASSGTDRYFMSGGWASFLRSNNLSDGDKCVIKFIRNEGKLCLAEVFKNKRPPCGNSAVEVVKRKRRQTESRHEHADGADVELWKRPRRRSTKQ